jgi:hypothetical protein
MNILLENWETFNETLGDDFRYAITAKVHNGDSILFSTSKNLLSGQFSTLLEKISQTLSNDEIKKLIYLQNVHNETILMIASFSFNPEDLKSVLNLIKNNLNRNELENFLLIENDLYETALQYAASSSESETFTTIKNLYEDFFNSSKIREILIKVHKNNVPFIFSTIDHGSKETVQDVQKILSSLFENHPQQLRELLMHQNDINQTIFSKLKYQTMTAYKSAFESLLRNTFLRIDNKKFEEFLRISYEAPRIEFKFSRIENFETMLEIEYIRLHPTAYHRALPISYESFNQSISNNLNKFLNLCEVNSGDQNFFYYSIDFEDLINNWEIIRSKLESENIKKVLMYKNNNNENLIHNLLTNDSNLIHLEPFLKISRKELNATELYQIFNAQDSTSKATPLMLAAWKGKEYFEIFVNFVKKLGNTQNLGIDLPSQSAYAMRSNIFDLQTFLTTENTDNFTALQFSSFNANPENFVHVKNVYESVLTLNDTKNIILKTNNDTSPFIYDVIEGNNQEVALEVANYLRYTFRNEKLKLKAFLSHRENSGYTNSIFQYFKNKNENQKNLNIFKDLLKFTCDEEENFEKYLKDLENDYQEE